MGDRIQAQVPDVEVRPQHICLAELALPVLR